MTGATQAQVKQRQGKGEGNNKEFEPTREGSITKLPDNYNRNNRETNICRNTQENQNASRVERASYKRYQNKKSPLTFAKWIRCRLCESYIPTRYFNGID